MAKSNKIGHSKRFAAERPDTSPKIGTIDALCITWATVGAQIARFGTTDQDLEISNTFHVSYSLVSALVIATWWIALELSGSRETRVLGYGPDEYRRVISATLWLFGAVAIFSYVFQLDTARGYVAIALPLGILSLLTGRWTYRVALVSKRRRGVGLGRVMLIGSHETVEHLHLQLSRHPEAGYLPVAAYIPGGDSRASPARLNAGLPILGYSSDPTEIIRAIAESKCSTVAITAGSSFDPRTLRQLGWSLASSNIGMIMAPALTDVAGPRIHTQPVAGLPLIHVTTPKLNGGKGLLKRTFDLVSSTLLLAFLALPMAVIALAVMVDSPGPSIFRQTRIGRAGVKFEMMKFRSMVADAESKLTDLQARNEGAGLLFKMKNDPRITRVGSLIRRYSLDELPQLVNVLRGEMSLIGPRPPLPAEVAEYDAAENRRLLVKPGITGLWQVSGRSDLSWEDSIRLDLYYVENWSIAQDVTILIRTVRAVMSKSGAY